MSGYHTIHLHGALGKEFGKSFRLMVETPGEALHALSCQLPALRERISAGSFRCVVGRKKTDKGMLDEHEIYKAFPEENSDFHLVPAIAGRGRGTGKIIVGILLIALAVAAPYLAPLVGLTGIAFSAVAGIAYSGTIAQIGIVIALGGIAMAISPQPKQANPATAVQAATSTGFTFNGTDNVVTQGGAVPIIYGGPILVGGITIESGLNLYDVNP